jgi:pimeloyl-ACP methyl ester carboxylesterase
MKSRPAVALAGWLSFLAFLGPAVLAPAEEVRPAPPGRLVDLGGHRLHVDCRGSGTPTVVVENGLGDFSFDWALVRPRVQSLTRMCTYDRGGYAWSDPGPIPRTFAQLNLELSDALKALGEKSPYVLVGHSFGGPLARSFVDSYPADVAGMVLVDSVFEDQRVPIGGKAVRLRESARGRAIPPPREKMRAGDEPPLSESPAPAGRGAAALDPPYTLLPPAERRLRLWAQSLPGLDRAEDSQRDWSDESLARMHASPQDGSLGDRPLVVLTREKGGYSDRLDVPADELDAERLSGQAALARLSTNARQVIVPSGHAMHLEAPDRVASAIREVVRAVRSHRRLRGNSGFASSAEKPAPSRGSPID